MDANLQLGRVAGVRIAVNWSWLIVFALITWTLAAAVFPDQNPGLGRATYLAMAIVAALVFFLSLLLHELGHAVQARREGMEIEGITLWLFGGIASFRGAFPSAGAEFRIAIAGPLVSLAIGLAFVGAALALELPDAPGGVATWLGYINLVLLAFNMLPALPLDGGRVLRSTLWRIRGNFAWATRAAGAVSRGFGLLMIGAGFSLLIFERSFSGAWLAFLGWFLLNAVSAELGQARAAEALGDLRVAELMVRQPVVVPARVTLGTFMDHVAWAHRYTTYPVVDGNRFVGLLPFRRVAEVPRDEWDARVVADCMIPRAEVPILHGSERAVDVLPRLYGADARRGVVLDGEILVGFLSITDLVRALELGGGGRAPRRHDGDRSSARTSSSDSSEKSRYQRPTA